MAPAGWRRGIRPTFTSPLLANRAIIKLRQRSEQKGVGQLLARAKMLVMVAAVLAMAGCGVQQYAKTTNVAGYPYRHSDFDYKYAWKTALTDQGVAIDGVMKNVRYAYIDSVLLTVNVLDKEGKLIARASDFPGPQQTREGDVSQFKLLLGNIKPAAGDTYQFIVHYRGNEGGNQSGVDWISSFKVDALTGAVIRPPARDPNEW